MLIPLIETKTREEIESFQASKLQELLQYLKEKSPFYQALFKQHYIDIAQIKSLEDLKAIPVTTKDDLQLHNDEFLCVPKTEIIDYLTTSGTLGEPVLFAETEADLQRLAYNEYISFVCADATKDDIFQLTVTLDRRFMAGLAYYEGIRKLGAGVVRVGSGNLGLQFDTIARVKPTAIVVVPSFLLKMVNYAENKGIDYKNSSITKAVCIGEPLRNKDFSLNTLGKKIKEKWDLDLYSTYASTEMSAAFTECTHGIGGHLHPELIIVEFLDEDNNPVAEDAPGEVTITNLGVEGMPLLRFKTGDICYHYNESCACGRNTTRLGPIVGRAQQMIKYKGTTLYPPAFYDVLNSIQGVENYIVEVSTNSIGTDDVTVRVGCKSPTAEFERLIKDCFVSKLRVKPQLVFEPVDAIAKNQFPEMARKPITFVDKRKTI